MRDLVSLMTSDSRPPSKEDDFGVAVIEAFEFAAEDPIFLMEEHSHGLVRSIGRGEHLACSLKLHYRLEQGASKPTSASVSGHLDQLNEVATEEVSWTDNDVAIEVGVTFWHVTYMVGNASSQMCDTLGVTG